MSKTQQQPDAIAAIRNKLPKREHRVFPVGEGALELRAAAGGSKGPAVGMFIPYDRRSVDMWGWDGEFCEVIKPGAFTKTLQERGSDVVALFNHDPNWVLGRQSNRTLTIQDSPTGLQAEVQLDPTNIRWHGDVAGSIERRDVIGSSFGFETIRDNWISQTDGSLLRELVEVRLYDVSPVTFPAYPDSDAEKRSVAAAAVRAGFDVGALMSLLAKLEEGKVPLQQAEEVRSWIGRLQGVLPLPPAPPVDWESRLKLHERVATA